MDLTPQTIVSLNKDQMELLKELGDLARKEAELTEIIDTNRRMAEKVGLVRDKIETKSITEDHEFDNLLSVQTIYEREQVKSKIKSIFGSLINSGLGNLGIV